MSKKHKTKDGTQPQNDSPTISRAHEKEESWGHRALILLRDLICLRDLLRQEPVSGSKALRYIKEVSSHIFNILDKGNPYEVLACSKIPPSFLRGQQDFLDEESNKSSARGKSAAIYTHSLEFVESVVEEFGQVNDNSQELKDAAQQEGASDEDKSKGVTPAPQDILLLRRGQSSPKDVNEEEQTGNERLLSLVDQYVKTNNEKDRLSTLSSHKRAQAAIAILDLALESEGGRRGDDAQNKARFLVAPPPDSDALWQAVSRTDAAEITLVLLFEKFLERDHAPWGIMKKSSTGDDADKPPLNFTFPGTDPIASPESHDVLFGRGGLTNNHPGNRRFRDIISLHRPDYVIAIKVEKPNVARRIVKAIRAGSPPGRFLKKNSKDDMWYDVGDRHAAEKTSQALREKVKDKSKMKSPGKDKSGTPGEAGNKQAGPAALPHPANAQGVVPLARGGSGAQVGPYTMALRTFKVAGKPDVPIAPRENDDNGQPVGDKEKDDGKKEKNDDEADSKKKDSSNSNVKDSGKDTVDEKGGIIVTENDILCGRGGLTNQHRGNKRFRDIVSLHREDYVRAPKVLKPNVARLIVGAIRNGDPPGRFLKKDPDTGLWYDIGDKRAAEKASQALRERPSRRDSGGEDTAKKRDPSTGQKAAVPIVPRPANTSKASDPDTTAEETKSPDPKEAVLI